jgi:serine/threonine protein kinase
MKRRVEEEEDPEEKRRRERAEKWKKIKDEKETELKSLKAQQEGLDVVTNVTITTNSNPVVSLETSKSHITSTQQSSIQKTVTTIAYDRTKDIDIEMNVSSKCNDEDDEDDMFSAKPSKLSLRDSKDMLDMFADDTTITHSDQAGNALLDGTLMRGDAEPTDDHEGYYCYRLGELLGKRYAVIGYHGKGVFSNVLKCRDTHTNEEVAIKLLRNNEHMKRAGKKEIEILKTLRESDPEGKYNNITLRNDFEDRDHLCLVFEPMDMNLRQLMKKYGGQGISVTAIRVYAFKILKALTHLARNNIIHADIKPDNILIDKDRTMVKVADLGSAMDVQEAEPTPMLVSRYYRGPEIVLGINYNTSLDVFSLGCCLYELATGKPLLLSRDNNHHLKLICLLKGGVSKKLLQRARYKELYFDATNTFLETLPDPADKTKDIVRKVHFSTEPTRNLYKEILAGNPHANSMEKKQIQQLADLIDKCTEMDPDKRISARDCLKHPLFADPSTLKHKKVTT